MNVIAQTSVKVLFACYTASRVHSGSRACGVYTCTYDRTTGAYMANKHAYERVELVYNMPA